MKNKIFTLFISCIMVICLPFSAMAHSGRTDSSGGHKDNKNKSGLGGYHYHCGGNPPHLHSNGVCPYKSSGSSNVSSSSTSNNNVKKAVYATSITPQDIPTSIDIGAETKLSATVYPADAEDKTITWSSSDSNIVKVSETGEMTAVGVGNAVITAKTDRGTSKQFTITVNEITASSIDIKNHKSEVLIGEEFSVSCEFVPKNTTNKIVEWQSSDETVATITSDGKITAKSIGNVIITATHKEIKDSFTLEVKPIEVKTVTIILPDELEKNGEAILRIKQDEELQLETIIEPSNATYKDIEWKVSDSGVGEVDENGLLKACGKGTITITAIAKNGVKNEIEIEVYSEENWEWVYGLISVVVIVGAIIIYAKRKKRKS